MGFRVGGRKRHRKDKCQANIQRNKRFVIHQISKLGRRGRGRVRQSLNVKNKMISMFFPVCTSWFCSIESWLLYHSESHHSIFHSKPYKHYNHSIPYNYSNVLMCRIVRRHYWHQCHHWLPGWSCTHLNHILSKFSFGPFSSSKGAKRPWTWSLYHSRLMQTVNIASRLVGARIS